MTVTMVNTARSHREFITYLPGERWASREAHVVSVRWLLATDQARLLGNEPDVIAVADPPRLREGKRALIDCLQAPLLHRWERITPVAALETLRPRCPLHQWRRC
jgi:hypothetical protein